MGMMISLDSDNYLYECKVMIAIQLMRSHYWVIYRRSQVPLADSFPTVPLSACIIGVLNLTYRLIEALLRQLSDEASFTESVFR